MKIREQLEKTLKASRNLNLVSEEQINRILMELADEAEKQSAFILEENRKDLSRMDPSDPKYDRLKLTDERLRGITADMRNVATLPSPVGKILSETLRPNGLKITKVSVPFGVIGIIYEARPNVTFDVFSLCLKSGNACVLKGGSDAISSNTAILAVIHHVLDRCGIDRDVVTLLPAGREETAEMMNARGYIDLIIPRGSQSLIDFVRENSKIPVIETGAGICHTYFDETGDREKGREIIYNAKTRRPSVCNALDCLVVHRSRLADLPYLAEKLARDGVVVYADNDAWAVLNGHYPQQLLFPADEKSFGTEFLSLKMAVKTVDSFEEAVNHISEYSSKHSEAIIAEDEEKISRFQKLIDASSVYANVSTAFTDGAQFGLGAEIGISTQKLHARGPMALEELTSYKWIIEGTGQVRPK
ncbi:MAG TPA: glutamate-5-semialdehyde dehydrogenase [Prolixibacteraceae bacterium]|nr:glutamate-5-semialdehyde dehydrogenase [Prolixibacteraceae bacterium]